jgi:hypothetical protein
MHIKAYSKVLAILEDKRLKSANIEFDFALYILYVSFGGVFILQVNG